MITGLKGGLGQRPVHLEKKNRGVTEIQNGKVEDFCLGKGKDFDTRDTHGRK